jgi:hypothetical protein
MAAKNGAEAPNTPSFSEPEGRDDRRTDRESDGCEFHTPSGPCGDDGRCVTIAGVSVELCEPHLEAARELNGVAGGAT